MMLAADIVAIGPAAVYRVLKRAGAFNQRGRPATTGTGVFISPNGLTITGILVSLVSMSPAPATIF